MLFVTIPYLFGCFVIGIAIGLVIRAMLCPASNEDDESKVSTSKRTTGRLL